MSKWYNYPNPSSTDLIQIFLGKKNPPRLGDLWRVKGIFQDSVWWASQQTTHIVILPYTTIEDTSPSVYFVKKFLDTNFQYWITNSNHLILKEFLTKVKGKLNSPVTNSTMPVVRIASSGLHSTRYRYASRTIAYPWTDDSCPYRHIDSRCRNHL